MNLNLNIIDKWFKKKEILQVAEEAKQNIVIDINDDDLLLLSDFCGQTDIIEFLKLQLEVARTNKQPFPHLLITGPPGLGKSLLAKIISNELNAYYKEFTASTIKLVGTNYLEMSRFFDINSNNKVLFIDEIHNLNVKVAETIYNAVQDFRFNGESISPFTLIGATTFPGKMSQPLKDRMDILQLRYYSPEELAEFCGSLGIKDEILGYYIANRAKGTPRLARKYAKKILDAACYDDSTLPSLRHAEYVFGNLKIDSKGFSEDDLSVLRLLHNAKKPLSKSTICATLSLDPKDYDTLIEPFLLKENLLTISTGGRILTSKGAHYINQ